MNRFFATGLMALFLVAADQPKKDPGKEDEKKLQGTWTLVRGVRNGEDIADKDLDNFMIEIKGSQIVFLIKGEKPGPASFKLDATKTPKQIDAIPAKGSKKGEKFQGVYELNKNNLTIFFADPDKPRPQSVKSRTATGYFLLVLQRK